MQSAEYRGRKSTNNPKSMRFEGLLVWQKAQALAAEITLLVDSLPARKSAGPLGHQLSRSGGSVAANIAEGYGRYSEAAYRNHLSIARGSLFEAESRIDLSFRVGYIRQEQRNRLIEAAEEVARLTTATMKPLKARGATAIREERVEYITDEPE